MQNPESFTQTVARTETSAKAGFTRIYAEGNPPWDIGKPQPPYLEIADQVESPVLDAGCGTGNTALFFAARGREVTGIDFVEEALQRARAKALARGLTAEFLLRDAMTLATWDRRFASVIDSGLFHVYHGDDQRRYVAGLHHVLQPGGRLFLFSFTADDEHPEDGVSPRRLADIFSPGFRIESTRITQGELNPAFVAETPDAYPEGGPPMIFAVIRRTE